jgi:hypothetical protein
LQEIAVNISTSTQSPQIRVRQPQSQPKTAPETAGQAPKDSFSFDEFYSDYRTPIHVGGGALIGAGIAHLAGGAVGAAVVSAAGTGALVGWLVGSKKSAICTAGGAVLGASIAAMAGVPGAAVMNAAGTGALIGWVLS